jgi:hypothetical protein
LRFWQNEQAARCGTKDKNRHGLQRPTREEHRILANMTPGERMKRAMDLSDMGFRMLKANLRWRFPELDEERLHRLFLERLAQCHNREY